MAAFFGEVVPVVSRAVDDDDDENEQKEHILQPCICRWTPSIEAELSQSENSCLHGSTFVIAIGPAAVGFSHVYLRNNDYERIGAVFSSMADGDANTLGQRSPTDKTCYIYRQISDPSVFLCECNATVVPEQAFSWVQQFFSIFTISSAYVGILSTSSVSGYLSDSPVSEMSVPFVRALRTSLFQGTPFCPYLEQPNVMSGLPAQILTYCELQKARCVSYVCYTDSLFVELSTIKSFHPVLKYTPFRFLATEKKDTVDEDLQKLLKLYATHDSLYL